MQRAARPMRPLEIQETFLAEFGRTPVELFGHWSPERGVSPPRLSPIPAKMLRSKSSILASPGS